MNEDTDETLMTCDCCGQLKEGVMFVVAYGLDTFACPECRGLE